MLKSFIKYFTKHADFILQTLLVFIVSLMLVYSFVLSLKRYDNYEYGKFDLGNMSQMVWNSAHFRFMEVTDQFGTNMPRWGMSHVDPVLLVFVPIYWIYAHPMIMVFIQQIVVLSGAFAIYYLLKHKTSSPVLAFLAAIAYTFYPAIGYTLIWTTYHGISFVAPILLWIAYFLEKNDFLKNEKSFSKKSILYWIALIFLLLGKEQVGVMTGLAAFFIYKHNKKLAIQTAVISFVWFFIAFFVLIPHYAPLREVSVNNFIAEVGIVEANPERVQGDNFFLVRYEYLGDSYGEMLKNVLLNPQLVFGSFSENLKTINSLIGPLGYIVIFSPFWLMSFPDFAISILSKEEIFGIDNHRVAIIISALFISYVYLLVWINKKYKLSFAIIFALLSFVSTIYFSYSSYNPLFISATSFINEKVIKKVFAQNENSKDDNELVIGQTKKGGIPRNENACLNYVVESVYEKNPDIYTGPDYLGAHTSNRRVNALFPARISDADMIVVDLFDEKAIDRVGAETWFTNKLALEKIVLNDYKHLFSCGMLNVFEKEKLDQAWTSSMVEKSTLSNMPSYLVETSKVGLNIVPIIIPTDVVKSDSSIFKLAMSKTKGGFTDSISYWNFEGEETSYSFIDYITAGNSTAVDKTILNAEYDDMYFVEEIGITFPEYVKSGKYKIFYGVGDLVRGTEVYLGEVNINE